MKERKEYLPWTTETEMHAIDELGCKSGDRRSSLNGYIQSCDKRVEWGSIDKDVVLAYAQKSLAILR